MPDWNSDKLSLFWNLINTVARGERRIQVLAVIQKGRDFPAPSLAAFS